MIQPLDATEEIRDAYLRYLRSSYPFQRPDLRQKFHEEVSEPNALVKGPLLESTPPFRTGASIANLVDEGVLHSSFEELCSGALPYKRPLYLHQEESVRKSVSENRNLVIATGTGSGKTEAFLIPLLDHLLREIEGGTLSTPGVRSLLLYPMNALANDQLSRLRSILEEAPFPITFGRYTGETAYDREDAVRNFKAQFQGEPIIENELLCRNKMRETPPHILVTNYAMLEYLLLRPEDHIFFDNSAGTWESLVLDEAHTYDGATGIELGMLTRRLKERIQAPSLSCMATSATIGEEGEDFPAVAEFATSLFGEPFEWERGDVKRQDVVAATRRSAGEAGPVWGEGTAPLYRKLHEVLEAAEEPGASAEGDETAPDIDASEWVAGAEEEISEPDSDRSQLEKLAAAARPHVSDRLVDAALQVARETGKTSSRAGRFLHRLLRGDDRLKRLKEELSNRPLDVREVSGTVFPEMESGQANQALIHLVSVAVRARLEPSEVPLLPARYHVFARALEGAFACLNTEAHTDEKAWLGLKRREECPDCEGDVQELASCKFCGATYLVGRKERGDAPSHFQLDQIELRPGEQSASRSYFLLGARMDAVDEDREVTAEAESSLREATEYTLCTGCGTLARGVPIQCECESATRVTVDEVVVEGGEPPRECISCGKRSSRAVLYRFLTGQDAPVSVLATSLYQQLPPARDAKLRGQPGDGRKLLTFADSRQDAAFFAPFMQRTYDQLLHRRLILKTLRKHPSGREGKLRMPDAVSPLVRSAETAGAFSQDQSQYQREKAASKWLMRELVAWDDQQSLEGVGLLRFDLAYEFSKLDGALERLDAYSTYSMPPHEREARFKSAVLTRRLEGVERARAIQNINQMVDRTLVANSDLLVFELAEGSVDVNVREGDINYVLSPIGEPNFLDKHPYPRLVERHQGDIDYINGDSIRESRCTGVSVEGIDRVNGYIALSPGFRCDILSLEQGGAIDFTGNVILDYAPKDYQSKKIRKTLQAIGCPPIAYHDERVLEALGAEDLNVQNDEVTPVSRFIWQAPQVEQERVERDADQLLERLEEEGIGLNESQADAVSRALTRRIALLWGPPGTGKSWTLRAIVLAAVTDAIEEECPVRILVTAGTYTAVDNVLTDVADQIEKFADDGEYNLSRLQSELHPDPTELMNSHENIDCIQFGKWYAPNELLSLKDRLTDNESVEIVFTTAHQLYNLAVARAGRAEERIDEMLREWFDVILIDEASQLETGLSTLVLSKVSEGGQVILAGDDLQLPPIHNPEYPEGLENIVGSSYNFFRHYHNIDPVSLKTNYRSNETIVSFTRQAGYDEDLSSFSPDLRLQISDQIPNEKPDYWPDQLYWTSQWGNILDPYCPAISYVYSDKVSSQVNDFEADSVASLVKLLFHHHTSQLANERVPGEDTVRPLSDEPYDASTFWKRFIGVVTPHRAQMSKIIHRLQSVFPNHPATEIRDAVDTVERFQGQQRDVMIASLGVGDPDLIEQEDEFLYSLNRFNVLSSRARAKLIVLAPQTLIDYLSDDSEVLQESRLIKTYTESFCRDGTPVELGFFDSNNQVQTRDGLLRRRVIE